MVFFSSVLRGLCKGYLLTTLFLAVPGVHSRIVDGRVRQNFICNTFFTRPVSSVVHYYTSSPSLPYHLSTDHTMFLFPSLSSPPVALIILRRGCSYRGNYSWTMQFTFHSFVPVLIYFILPSFVR